MRGRGTRIVGDVAAVSDVHMCTCDRVMVDKSVGMDTFGGSCGCIAAKRGLREEARVGILVSRLVSQPDSALNRMHSTTYRVSSAPNYIAWIFASIAAAK